ncbi:hypothetical protein GCM10027430_19920 [Lysobacter tyrosinilyticus]
MALRHRVPWPPPCSNGDMTIERFFNHMFKALIAERSLLGQVPSNGCNFFVADAGA